MYVQPAPPLAVGFAQDPSTDGHDITALFRNGYEILGIYDSSLRLAPSNECFGAGEGSRREIHLRLVVEGEFAAVQGMTQTTFDGLPLQGMFIHAGLEKLVIIPPIALGIQHCDVCVLDERLCVRPVIRVDSDSHAQSYLQIMLLDAVGHAYDGEDMLRGMGGICCMRHRRQEDHKFVAALAANRI